MCHPDVKVISNSLPEKDKLNTVITALLQHMGNPDHAYASILPCVRTLVMLTDHDYGFYHLVTCLEKNTTVFSSLLSRVNNTFSKDSSDCLSTLSVSLDFLRLLVSLDPPEEEDALARSYIINKQQLRGLLSWTPDQDHPLDDLEKLLEVFAKEEESLESLLESITSLTKMLRDPDITPGKDLIEPELSPPEPLSVLFNKRAVFTISDGDDKRLSATYWLANPITEEPDSEPELVRCNLGDLCSKYFPEFDLEQELRKDSMPSAEDIVKPRRLRDRRRSQEVININHRGRRGNRPFVAPMRGRGITHGMMASNRSDPFRSRPPNTSRPPSMHVDDFIKMEKNQRHPDNSPQGQHIHTGQPRRNDKEQMRGRGRGFGDRGGGRGFSSRGRFFTPPGNYARRDQAHGAGGSRGGTSSYMGRQKYNFASPRSFQRGGHGDRASPTDRRGGGNNSGGSRDSRFAPRGGRGGGGSQWLGKGKDDGRFSGSFRGRRDFSGGGRHFRSFTK